MRAARDRFFLLSSRSIALVGLLSVTLVPQAAQASEAGQGSFSGTLTPGVGCGPGAPALLEFTSTFSFDDKTFQINMPPGNNTFDVNFSELGTFQTTGEINCVFDVGGEFVGEAVNEAGDFRWVDMRGEYLDHKPGISEGDPFPWVAGARCETTRTDNFKTLCDNFELSWNGLSRMLAPNPGYNDFAGDLNIRTANRGHVTPNGNNAVGTSAEVDGPGGDVPEVVVTFNNGVMSEGDVSVSTLADAHGTIPDSVSIAPRGTTEIDHGDGAVPFFENGDETFLEISTDADLPNGPDIEVCLPMPVLASPADARPVHVLHGEGADFLTRKFVDRTSDVDPSTGKACASVSSFSRFAVVTSDLCGKGRKSSDGILTVAGGLIGKKTVIVDGVTDCTELPADFPSSLAKLCVPDADGYNGQCTLSLKLGVDRAGCNAVAAGIDASASDVDVYSYDGTIHGKTASVDLGALFHDALYGLVNRTEATVGPVAISLPASGSVAKYKLSHHMNGGEPGSGDYVLDKDAATILCIEP